MAESGPKRQCREAGLNPLTPPFFLSHRRPRCTVAVGIFVLGPNVTTSKGTVQAKAKSCLCSPGPSASPSCSLFSLRSLKNWRIDVT